MNFPFSSAKEDLPLIRKPVSAAVAVIVICAGLYWGGLSFRDAQRQSMLKTAADLQQAESLYRNVLEEKRTILNYLDRYRQLSVDGIIGQEDRLGLIEKIGRIRETHRLFPIEVEITPQFAVTGTKLQETGTGPILHASAIRFSLPLLHEGDLFRLLEGLHEIRWLLVAETCTMERLSSGVDLGRLDLAENMNASCRFFWVTIQGQGQ
jgi:hypothetical protein